MLTYDLGSAPKPIYKALYELIKEDIKLGNIMADEKMPSKRALARNLGISTITVENAYDQLIGEGYMYALPKRGYFVSNISGMEKIKPAAKPVCDIKLPDKPQEVWFDFSSNRTESDNFPFSVWAKIMRETISLRERELLEVSPCGGVYEIRQAIARHLSSFRGMSVDPDQIIVGAGTEYLYGLLIKLLGKDKVYCIENPGYKKLKLIYENNGAICKFADMDESGIVVDALRSTKAEIAHISPTHHFPTGITMPVSRRYELLAWANEEDDRYIIEDDYDSEFRLNGKPIPPLQSIDACGKIIYMNTFSKSLTSTIRISYMVLPEALANRFYKELSFYSCTVSTFEQYALASFIDQGYFEKHINRMRRHYGRKRTRVLETIKRVLPNEKYHVIENDSGLHFIMEIDTDIPDQQIKQRLLDNNIRISTVSDYDMIGNNKDQHRFIINYSSMEIDKLERALEYIK